MQCISGNRAIASMHGLTGLPEAEEALIVAEAVRGIRVFFLCGHGNGGGFCVVKDLRDKFTVRSSV